MSGCGAPKVLIVGAAHGVGKACARLLAARGASLTLADIDGDALASLAAETGGKGRFCDVASESSVEIFARGMTASQPSLDVLINAAGPAYVRSLGVLRMSNAVLPCLTRAGRPALVVNVGSARLACADSGGFRHASSRAAFTRLSYALGERLRPRSILVRAVMPGAPSGSLEATAHNIVAMIADRFPMAEEKRRRA